MSNQISIGVIFCCYGQPYFINDCLKPWLELKKDYNIKIASVNGMFKEMRELGYEDNDKKTQDILQGYYDSNKIDYLFVQNPNNEVRSISEYGTESDIRNKGLQYLLEENVDYILLLDSDENFSVQEIKNVTEYIQKDPFIEVYNIEFKNLIWDNKYIKGFCPQRIWKVNTGDYVLNSVVYDNDCDYIHKMHGTKILDKLLSHKKIPINLCNPIHHSWDDFERSCQKINYQLKRWLPPNGNGCSFKINEEKQCIEWDTEYFKRIGQNQPETFLLNET